VAIADGSKAAFAHVKLAAQRGGSFLSRRRSALQIGSSPLGVRKRTIIPSWDLLSDSALNARHTVRRQVGQRFSFSWAYEAASVIRPAVSCWLLRTSQRGNQERRERSAGVSHKAGYSGRAGRHYLFCRGL
jgi:hypothetical protein